MESNADDGNNAPADFPYFVFHPVIGIFGGRKGDHNDHLLILKLLSVILLYVFMKNMLIVDAHDNMAIGGG